MHMQDDTLEIDLLDDLFAEAVEDIKQEEVTVEEQERTRWPHVLRIKADYSSMMTAKTKSVEYIAKMIHKKLQWMGCETSYNKEKYDKYERNEDETFSFVEPGDKFLVGADTYLIGFDKGFITFAGLYHILELLAHTAYYIDVEIDKVSSKFSKDGFIEKTCFNILGLDPVVWRRKHYECIEREIAGMHYTKKFIKKIANLKSTGNYKFLNCFDVFEDCRLRDSFENRSKSASLPQGGDNTLPQAPATTRGGALRYNDPKNGGAIRIMENNEDFYWDGTPKMSNIKHELPVTDTLLVGNDIIQMRGMLYWTANLEMLRGTQSYPDAFMPKPLSYETLKGAAIVGAEILLIDNGRIIIIMELQHFHREDIIDVTVPWLTIEASNFRDMEFMLENMLEEEGDVCAEIIREEVYNRTHNKAYSL